MPGRGEDLILDRELRTVKHFSKLPEDEMMKAFDAQVWSYIIQEQLGETLESLLKLLLLVAEKNIHSCGGGGSINLSREEIH